MQISIELIGTIGFYAILPTIPLLPVALIIGLVLHNTLISRLDPILFREPYFHRKELGMYVVWPFTFFKTVAYIMLITCPKMAKWRRFKAFDGRPAIERPLMVLCYVEVALFLLLGMAWVVMMAAGLVLWLIGNW